MKYRLILASASPRRKKLLEQTGAEFEVIPARGEEVFTGTSPEQAVLELSGQKAEEVAGRLFGCPSYGGEPEAVKGGTENGEAEYAAILGADTVVAFEGQILGKPENEADALRMLRMLSGNTHSVFTGVTVIAGNGREKRIISFAEETKVTMYPMTEEQIQAYVETKEPMDKAGAYGIQGKCAIYIEKIEGDYNNVVGLPVAALYQKLTKSGIEIL
ncbi:septum formation protein Maf [Eubacterium sp. 14-2]|uniref:Maf family protein n=1 Tax=Eubacterium sp. 14-2 TaxID=1235790 RepID=UPI00033509D9|nr:Maf family protein [Eubacterium sp. 14-2]EOT27391.1 septum formation protein Maf [Eubacterium sp. 14-2]